jgi:hypothetical protein
MLLSLSAAALVPAAVACGDDDGDDGDVEGDVTDACDALEDLGNSILEAQQSSSVDEIRETVEPSIDSFAEAAESSGDETLDDLADTAQEAFDVYITAGGIDSREAGNEMDIAIDRAAARCLELGATNDFPEQP